MRPFGYLGIDFGTSNSHFAWSSCGGSLKTEGLRVGRKGDGAIPTCVLWRQPAQAEDDILDFGDEAIERWIRCDDGERKNFHFAFGFKPDLVHSERAQRDAWAFLSKARAAVENAGLPRPLERGGIHVVVGVPAEIGDKHHELTKQIAKDAGFGEVECVAEPLGALVYHLNEGHITRAEARKGIVVVDFGGGTLDVALVSSEGLHEPWGEPVLGGRLFDDLFFQWVCDRNAPLSVPENELLCVWQKDCREVKEMFSRSWANKKGDDLADFQWPVMVGDSRIWLKNASVAEFKQRARNYRPSTLIRKYFRGLDKVPNGLVDTSPIDLFAWIEQTLTRKRSVEALKGQFSKIILTGGSGHWPFMRQLVAEAFGVDPIKGILPSQQPETTIGAGLALYNVLKLQNDERRARILADKPAAVARFRATVATRFDRFADDLATAIIQTLMPRVEKVFWDWYNNGGSLNKVESEVDTICRAFEQNKEAGGLLKTHWKPLEADLLRLLRDHLKQFLAEHEIPTDATRYVPETATLSSLASFGDGMISDEIVRELGDLAEGLAATAAAIVTLVVAAVKIKIIILAALAHPILAILVGFGALLAWLGISTTVREKVESAVKSHEFNTFTLGLLKAAVWESKFRDKLATGRAEAKSEVAGNIRKQLRDPVPNPLSPAEPGMSLEQRIIHTFETILDQVVKDLGVLELIRHDKG